MEIVSSESVKRPWLSLVEVFPPKKVLLVDISDLHRTIYELVRLYVKENEPVAASEILHRVKARHREYTSIPISRALRLYWLAGLIRLFVAPEKPGWRARLGKEMTYYLINNLEGFILPSTEVLTPKKRRFIDTSKIPDEKVLWIRQNAHKYTLRQLSEKTGIPYDYCNYIVHYKVKKDILP